MEGGARGCSPTNVAERGPAGHPSFVADDDHDERGPQCREGHAMPQIGE